MKKNLSITLLTCLCAIALVNCSKENSKPKAHSANLSARDTLRIDIGNEPASLDPEANSDNSAARVQSDLFAQLVDYDQQGRLIPGLSESWNISPDGKTYTFHLRPNLKFSDGSPITAHDFVFSWRRLVAPKTSATYNFLLNDVINAESIVKGELEPSALGVAALDERTFVVRLNSPDKALLEKCSMTPLTVVSEKNLTKYQELWTQPEYMVTSGAYKLQSHVVNGSIRVSKNPYFYAESTVSIPNVVYFPYVDLNSSIAAYKSGDLDMTFISVPIDQFAQLKAEFPNELHSVRLEGMYYYTFNTSLEKFQDIRVRQALSMVIDREMLTNQLLNMGQTPLYSTVTATIEGGKYKDVKYNWASLSLEQRIAKAKKLYQEAGYSESNPLKITLLSNGDDLHKKIAMILIHMWKNNLGVDATFKNVDWKTFIQSRYLGNFELARGGWTGDYNSVTAYTPLYECDGRQNLSFYCDKQYDKLISEANLELNPQKEQRLYTMALNQALNDYMTIPLFQYSYQRLVKPYITNYQIESNTSDHVQSKWLRFAY